MSGTQEGGFVYAGVTRWGGGGSQTAKPGTLGGVFRKPIGGDAWSHMMTGFPEIIHVHCITVHPDANNIVFAGTHQGVFRSTDHGASWRRMALDPTEQQIWSITISPHDHREMYAGASPINIYVSHDAGESWTKVQSGVIPDRLPMGTFKNRVMRIVVNPKDPLKLCAALEVNGAMASEDGGKTWADRSDDLIRMSDQPNLRSQILTKSDAEGMLDAHALCVLPNDADCILLANRMGIFRSRNNGHSWEILGDRPAVGIHLRPGHSPLPMRTGRALCLSERVFTGANGIPGAQRRRWQDLDAIRPRLHARQHRHGCRFACGAARGRLFRCTQGRGLWHDRRRPHLAQLSLAGRLRGRCLYRVRLRRKIWHSTAGGEPSESSSQP